MRRAFQKIQRLGSYLLGVIYSFRPGVTAIGPISIDRWPKLARPLGGGRLILGNRSRIFPRVAVHLGDPDAEVKIGAYTFINRRTEIIAFQNVSIGSHCAISWDVCITDTDYHQISPDRPRVAPVKIGDRVW